MALPAMSFGPFHVLPIQRLLLEGDLLPRLGSRALDLLVALVERAGELVSKGELMARVWPIPSLKKAISESKSPPCDARRDDKDRSRYISTVAGRGLLVRPPCGASTI